ncbi:MAG: 30S ribosomal protein S21 [Holosporaceae bacterium]
MQVVVRDNDVDRALRTLKKMLQNDGFFRKMRLMRHHEKGSEKRLRKKEESIRRIRKLNRKRQERFGY